MILIEDDQMIETFSADTSNYSFCVRILKRRMGRGDHFVNLHPFYPASKLRSIDRISIPEQISRRGVIGKCFDDLLCGPLGCRIRGHIEMNDLPATVKYDNTPYIPTLASSNARAASRLSRANANRSGAMERWINRSIVLTSLIGCAGSKSRATCRTAPTSCNGSAVVRTTTFI